MIAIIGAAVAASTIIFRTPPLSFPTCLFKLVTGAPCPSCGMTRGFIALGHGRLGEALHHNLMSPLLYIGLWFVLFVSAYDVLSGHDHLRRLWRAGERIFVAAALLLSLASWTWNIYKASASADTREARVAAGSPEPGNPSVGIVLAAGWR